MAKGKHAHSWNVIDSDGDVTSIDLQSDIASWEVAPIQDQSSDELLTNDILQAQAIDEVLAAKTKELSEWKSRGVYEEVEDEGQKRLSVRWVTTVKKENGCPTVKASLCARGFEEEKEFRTDSPTRSKESVRLTCILASSCGRKVQSLDIKRAFLQSKDIGRDVYLQPPKEANIIERQTIFGN